MKIFINILTTYFPDIDPPYDEYYEQILEQVVLAEELGWECFMFNEHHFLGYGGLVANPAVLLAAAAAQTSKIRLGTCIAILPLRHPLHSAEDYAMVDALSGGRLEFGIGSGNTEMDYKVFGVTRENDRQRLSEALEVILKVWGNERAGHKGEFWRFDELTLYPRPVQQPHPPIWVAGTSAEGLGWAGREGYNIMTVGHPHPPEKVRAGVDAWKKGLLDRGIDPGDRRCQYHVRTHVQESAERAAEALRQAERDRVEPRSDLGRRHAERHGRVDQPCAVEVHREADLPGRRDHVVELGQRPDAPAGAVVGVLERQHGSTLIGGLRARLGGASNLVRGEAAAVAREAPYPPGEAVEAVGPGGQKLNGAWCSAGHAIGRSLSVCGYRLPLIS